MGGTPVNVPAAIFCYKLALSTCPTHCQLQRGSLSSLLRLLSFSGCRPPPSRRQGRSQIESALACGMQNSEVAYLIYRGRFFYPVLVIAVTLLASVITYKTLRSQHSRVMALMNECRLTPLVQDKWVRAVASYRLVPGDVMVLQKGRALCDMVLLRGACLVTESMLSGEVSRDC